MEWSCPKMTLACCDMYVVPWPTVLANLVEFYACYGNVAVCFTA